MINMEIRYDNGYFKVVANPYEDCYYVVNKQTEINESTETAEATAKFKADALRAVTIKHNESRSKEDATA